MSDVVEVKEGWVMLGRVGWGRVGQGGVGWRRVGWSVLRVRWGIGRELPATSTCCFMCAQWQSFGLTLHATRPTV